MGTNHNHGNPTSPRYQTLAPFVASPTPNRAYFSTAGSAPKASNRLLLTPPPIRNPLGRHQFCAIQQSPKTPPAPRRRPRSRMAAAASMIRPIPCVEEEEGNHGHDENIQNEDDGQDSNYVILPSPPRPSVPNTLKGQRGIRKISLGSSIEYEQHYGTDEEPEADIPIIDSFHFGEDNFLWFEVDDRFDFSARFDEDDCEKCGGRERRTDPHSDQQLFPKLNGIQVYHEEEDPLVCLIEESEDSVQENRDGGSSIPMDIDESWSD
mmetsp:Transcript_9798/g.20265  ORF Transcript_9798/g.20265 Transcript_9798/m.20265 type:complete len:265 (+) Transcript_9798:65-859(+)